MGECDHPKRDEAVELLRELADVEHQDWPRDDFDVSECPWCRAVYEAERGPRDLTAHKPDCRLARARAFLAKLGGGT